MSWGGIAQAAASVIGGGLQIAGGSKARKDQVAQMDRDRQMTWDMWNKTNEFNSPIEQMKRLKAGGLNPNLMYGQGTVGNTTQASIPQSRPLPPPNVGEVVNSTINQITDLNMKEQQKDLMAIEAMKQLADTSRIKADAERIGLGNQTTKDLDQPIKGEILVNKARENKIGEELYKVSTDGMKAQVLNMQLRNTEQEIKNTGLSAQQQATLNETYGRMKMQQATTSAVETENALKQEVLQMRKKGIEVNDNLLLRIFGEFLPNKSDIKNAVNPKLE